MHFSTEFAELWVYFMRSREKGPKTSRGAGSSGQSTEQAGSLLLARPENWDQ